MTDIQKMKLRINAEIVKNRSNYALFNDGMKKGIEIALSQLQHANRWRKVSEELPEKELNVTMSQTLCLTRSKRYGIKLLAYNHDYNVWDDEQLDDYFCDKEVIEEWKPIE